MTRLKPRWERDDEDTPRLMFIEWLTGRLEEQYGVEAPSIAQDVAEAMDRIKVFEWCDLPNCFKPDCRRDTYVFNLTTHKDKFDLG